MALYPQLPCLDKLIEEEEIVEGTENVWLGMSEMHHQIKDLTVFINSNRVWDANYYL